MTHALADDAVEDAHGGDYLRTVPVGRADGFGYAVSPARASVMPASGICRISAWPGEDLIAGREGRARG